ncbi:MAG: NUDIX hydrolase [Acidimicrobiales bacterium]
MTATPDGERWQLLSRMVEVRSPWLSMIGERLCDATGHEREYWRVEKPDSLLVITIQNGRLVLPARSYRPGVGRATLDFAGGRLEDPCKIGETAQAIVRREFKLADGDLFVSQEELNRTGWDVDSASSSQRVYGVVAELPGELLVPEHSVGACYPATALGARELLRDLVCLQCRALLYEWLEKSR